MRCSKFKLGSIKPLIEPVPGFAVTFDEAVSITRKTPQTVRRWIREGWPPVYFDLISLYAMGRVKPAKWNHCFFNKRGNLEIYSVGEVAENDILNMDYLRNVNDSLKVALENKIKGLEALLEQANNKIEMLESCLDIHAPGGMAANDRKTIEGDP